MKFGHGATQNTSTSMFGARWIDLLIVEQDGSVVLVLEPTRVVSRVRNLTSGLASTVATNATRTMAPCAIKIVRMRLHSHRRSLVGAGDVVPGQRRTGRLVMRNRDVWFVAGWATRSGRLPRHPPALRARRV